MTSFDIDQPNPKHVKRIMVLGRVLPQSVYAELAEITPSDLEAIAEDWKDVSPAGYENLLESESD